jgi:hypothetical protein
MHITILVRHQHGTDVLNTYETDNFMVSHEDIMQATGNNPFYERGIVMDDGPGRIIQYVRIKEQA